MRTIKTKITAWLVLLMAVLSGLLLVFTLSISRSVSLQTAAEQLARTVRSNAAQVSLSGGRVLVGASFSYSHGGVSTLIYNKNEALLAGQLPVSFTADEPFQNGESRTVAAGDTAYLVLDLWVPGGWEDGVWLRGLMEAPDSGQTARNLLRAAAIALPLFLFLAAAGGYLLVRRALRPLDAINATASAISEARDLSRRIPLPPGRDEFFRLAENFNRLFGRLERSFEAEKQFTADASHELRTPVSVIKGACEYAQKYDETPEERQETLAMIHRQAVKMSDLISQLLRMTRLDQGTEPPGMEPVALDALAETVLSERAYDAARLRTDLQKGVIVHGDPALLSRLVQNLVDNAFRHGRPDGHVFVSVSGGEDGARLTVRDEGPGIPPEQQEKIWQRFYQIDPSRGGEKEGAGLGLALVRQIAQLHGGRMTLESAPEAGSVFTLHLPAEKN